LNIDLLIRLKLNYGEENCSMGKRIAEWGRELE